MISQDASDSKSVTFPELVAEWRAELASFFHEKMAARVGNGMRYLNLEMRDTEISVNLVDAGQTSEVGHVSRQGAQVAHSLSAIISNVDKISRDVAIEFPESVILRPRLQLPTSSESRMRQAAFYELERLSPINPEQIYFDLVVLKQDKAKGKTDLELRIIKRANVDDAVTLCRSAGLSVGSIGFTGDLKEADRRYFPVDNMSYLRMSWHRFNIYLLAGLALFLLVAILLAAYWRGNEQAGFLISQAEVASERAAVVHRLKRDIRDVQSQIEFPAAQKRAPLVIGILAELTRALPDGTWITNFALNGNKVHIEGLSKSASDLVSRIDRSPDFENAQFDSSLQSAADNEEHFDLTFNIKSRRDRR